MKRAPRKLLVLDVNGLLVDSCYRKEKAVYGRVPDGQVGSFFIYERPFCREFVEFCLQHFVVGVWSSARLHNVMGLISHVFGEFQEQLAFVWDQSKCTDTGLKHPENIHKPIFVKELSKLWSKEGDPDLPWEVDDFGPHNTLLIDDSPYKAMRNPPFTGIFPSTYHAAHFDDEELRPSGMAQTYLSDLLHAYDVPRFVEDHPYGAVVSFWPSRWPTGEGEGGDWIISTFSRQGVERIPAEEEQFSDSATVPAEEEQFSHSATVPAEEEQFSHSARIPRKKIRGRKKKKKRSEEDPSSSQGVEPLSEAAKIAKHKIRVEIRKRNRRERKAQAAQNSV